METTSPERHRRIAIIGAGPGGLVAAIRLKSQGYHDIVILEKSDGVGGTWNNTRYPGLSCDVESRVYSFSFEPNPEWSRSYATQPEILKYFEMIATKYRLRPHLRRHTAVQSARWDEAAWKWRLTLDGGEVLSADVVVAAQGMFNDLSWPDIAGLDDFTGTLFHAARWREDHDFTGKRLAVIGSAASAVQFIPEIAPVTAQIYVYQRSAPWIVPKDDPFVSGQERQALRANPLELQAARDRTFRELEKFITFNNPDLVSASTRAGLQNLESVRDPVVRDKLTPRVPFGCHRPLRSSAYYPTFNRDNVHLITDKIVGITAAGVVTGDGREREVDTIVCATGYHVRRYLTSIDVTGRGGIELKDAWRDGAHAYLGTMTAGFPNLFMMYGPNTNNGSILFMLEQQADFLVNHLQLFDQFGWAWADIRADVEKEYNARLEADLNNVPVWQAGCSNYYRTESGRNVTQWPHTMGEYGARCQVVDPTLFDVAP